MQFTELHETLTKLTFQLPADYALYVKFLNTNQEIAINESNQFWAASTIKIAVIVELYKQAAENKINLDQTLTIKPENMVKGSGIMHLLDPQNSLKIIDLAKLMIILSDNAATNELIDLLTWEQIENSIQKLGLKNTNFRHKMMIAAGRGPNLTTAKDMALLLEKLYKNELPGAQEILDIMNEVKLRERMTKLLPNDIKVPHKPGSLPRAVHDVGIVYAKEPFIFCFYSDDQTDKIKTADTIAECAKLCFAYANN